MEALDVAQLGGLLVALGGLARLAIHARSENRRTDAETDEIQDRLRKQLMEDVEQRIARMRDELLEARAAHAKTLERLAASQSSYAELEAKSSKERHDLKESLAILDQEVKLRDRKIESLENRVETLEAQLALKERRQDGGRRSGD